MESQLSVFVSSRWNLNRPTKTRRLASVLVSTVRRGEGLHTFGRQVVLRGRLQQMERENTRLANDARLFQWRLHGRIWQAGGSWSARVCRIWGGLVFVRSCECDFAS